MVSSGSLASTACLVEPYRRPGSLPSFFMGNQGAGLVLQMASSNIPTITSKATCARAAGLQKKTPPTGRFRAEKCSKKSATDTAAHPQHHQPGHFLSKAQNLRKRSRLKMPRHSQASSREVLQIGAQRVSNVTFGSGIESEIEAWTLHVKNRIQQQHPQHDQQGRLLTQGLRKEARLKKA